MFSGTAGLEKLEFLKLIETFFFFLIICVCRVVQWRRQSRADVPWKRSHERHHSVSIVLLKRARERKRERRHRHQLSY